MTALPDTPTAAELRAAVALLENHGDIVGNVSAAMLKRMRNAAAELEASAPAPAHSPLDRAVDYLTDRGACPDCGHPVHTTSGPDRGWIHTETGQYTCPPGTAGTMAGPGVTSDMLEAKYDEGHADGCAHQEEVDNETMHTEDELSEAVDKARQEGRTELHNEMDEAISAAMEQIGDDATADELREALASAWNSVAP
ncbi:hypothetical protein KNV18_gp53 [Mycobacterium phage Heath]|uniref:Uncharacterized protein n=2 Tax=Coopervirus TaxID=1982898 RepID=G1BLB1_9CAUD|nr:hypothetical protein FDI63_gp054 [Mycobacterium phage ChrisnMich]YP_010109596.1 hypothetical protein KNV18_gp53 [Mycobacterium phage Heath]AEJ94623.1 hypothetical protein CHRISNMICH_54 [Mycobacterium phage ChrisnMich]QNJ56118.1 hypothetical protein SEA_HEATH_53 [Mycobacterium phage Heath]